MRPSPWLAAASCVLVLLQACTTAQQYAAAQAVRRNECHRLPDKQESDRCLAQAGGSYDDYERERGAFRR